MLPILPKASLYFTLFYLFIIFTYSVILLLQIIVYMDLLLSAILFILWWLSLL